MRWAELEGTIKDVIFDLSDMRHMTALAVTAHINERMLVDIAKSLVHLFVQGPEAKLAADMKAHLTLIVEKIYPKRNDMVHSVFGYGNDGKTTILPIRARGELKFGPRKSFSSDDIEKIAEEIYIANDKLCGFADRLRLLIPTWHHIRR